MNKITLNGEWILKNPKTDAAYKATVPGDVHNDLMKAAVIPDPYYSDNANNCGMLPFLYDRKENDGLLSLLPTILGK